MSDVIINVLSLYDFNIHQPDPNAIAISIVDHIYTGPDDVKALNRYRASLQLSFEDWEFEHNSVKMFTDEHAMSIFKFLHENKFGKSDGANKMVVHCYQGISRSPAVSIGVCFAIDDYEKAIKMMRQFPGHNRYVLGMMMRNSGKILSCERKEWERNNDGQKNNIKFSR